jgi:hypothetical protein
MRSLQAHKASTPNGPQWQPAPLRPRSRAYCQFVRHENNTNASGNNRGETGCTSRLEVNISAISDAPFATHLTRYNGEIRRKAGL